MKNKSNKKYFKLFSYNQIFIVHYRYNIKLPKQTIFINLVSYKYNHIQLGDAKLFLEANSKTLNPFDISIDNNNGYTGFDLLGNLHLT
jgi:hypothetical protein